MGTISSNPFFIFLAMLNFFPNSARGKSPNLRSSILHFWGRLGVLVCLLWSLGLGHPAGNAQAATVSPATPETLLATEQRLKQAQTLFDQALNATQVGDFAQAEGLWSKIIDLVPENPATWSNRGNAKVSQGKLTEALPDYGQAIRLAPDQTDAYLNRGTAEEGLGQWQAAIDDYNRVLALDSQDPAAYNNRGNAQAGLGNWQAALDDYYHAFELLPDYAFARGNYALALYQVGKADQAIKAMQDLVRRYPKFADMRAALSVALWSSGRIGEAESHWVAAVGLDARYKDPDWVANIRRWPPTMVAALERFLTL
jgi:tetratricopeptide (TPR) repeat protein